MDVCQLVVVTTDDDSVNVGNWDLIRIADSLGLYFVGVTLDYEIGHLIVSL